jgi:prevent-host-death family protein
MTVIVALLDATLHLADLIEQVATGEEIVMVQAGRPVARLLSMAGTADQADAARLNARRSLQAGLGDPPSPQVQWTAGAQRQTTG